MRTHTILLLIFLAVIATWGIARAVLGNPSTVDRYSVISGDTFLYTPKACLYSAFDLGCPSQRLRLEGADAFEPDQTCRDAHDKVWDCGAAATAMLKQFVAQPDFSCRTDPRFLDAHGRQFSVCFADGRDVGAALVREGLAFAYGRETQYLPLENEARAARRGGWSGHFIRPQYWQQGARD